MKILFFTLPIIAYNAVWDGGKMTRFWDSANRLWCSSGGSDFSYSASNSKSCCSKMTGNVSFTSDGYCTSQEDFINGPIYAIYEQCCFDFHAFTAAHTINGVTPSRVITVGCCDVPVNDTSLPNIDESIPTGPSNVKQIPLPTSVTKIAPKVPENGGATTVSAPASSAASDSGNTKSDSNTGISSSDVVATSSLSNSDKNSKSAPTGKPLDSVAGSNTSTSATLTSSGYATVLITSIIATLYN